MAGESQVNCDDFNSDKLGKTTVPDLQEMDPTDVPTSALMGKSFARKIVITLVMWLTASISGFRVSANGATLVDIQEYTNSTNSEISFLFIASTIVGVVSAVLLVPLHNRFNTFLLVALCSIINGALTAATPWSTSVFVFIAISALVRAPLNVVSSGYFLAIAALWKNTGPAMNMAVFSYTLGSAIAPLVTIPFLSSGHNDTHATSVTSDVLQDATSWYTQSTDTMLTNVTVLPTTGETYSTLINSHSISPGTTEATTTSSAYIRTTGTQVQYVYLISGALSVFLVLLHLWIFNAMGRNPKLVLIKRNEPTAIELKTPDSDNTKSSRGTVCLNRSAKFWYELAVYITVTIAVIFVAGTTMTISSFLISFCHFELGLSKEIGAVILFVFTISGLVSSALLIPISISVRPLTLYFILATVSVITSFTCTMLITTHWLVIWVWAIILGFAVYPLYGLIQTIGNDIVKADGKFQTFFIVGSQSSHMVLPSLTGFLFDAVGHIVLLYIIASATLIWIICFMFLAFLHKKLKGPNFAKSHGEGGKEIP